MKKRKENAAQKRIAILTLLGLWQLAAVWVGRAVFLPSPYATLKALAGLLRTRAFYLSVGTSFVRIAAGFFLAIVTGGLLAIVAVLSRQLCEILNALMQLIKSVPVASFVILVLLWVRSRDLSIVISFFMVLPMIYINVRDGIRQTDPKLLEMAEVFSLPPYRKFRYIYLPAVMPYFVSACSMGLGFCWKSGIAAEVIGLPKNSIGEQLYEAKLYLMTPELFAWTAVIVAVSAMFEKIVMKGIKQAQTWATGGSSGAFHRDAAEEGAKKWKS